MGLKPEVLKLYYLLGLNVNKIMKLFLIKKKPVWREEVQIRFYTSNIEGLYC